MSCKWLRAAALTSAALTISGCDTVNRPIGQVDPFFGEAPRYNAAVQTINPDPVYAANTAQPGSMGAKGTAAVKRYRLDQVNERHRTEAAAASSGLSTTDALSQGGSGPR